MSSVLFPHLTTLNNADFSSDSKNQQLSALASHYMKMFDMPQTGKELLGKRSSQSLPNLSQKDPQKKVKPNSYTNNLAISPKAPFFTENPLQQAYMMNHPFKQQLNGFDQSFFELAAFQQNMAFGDMNNFGMGFNLGNSIKSHERMDSRSIKIKEEFVKQEECVPIPINPGLLPKPKISNKKKSKPQQHKDSTCSEQTKPEESVTESNVEPIVSIVEEPVLCEFTRSYPEWDLLTIFRFLWSGKPRNVFEAERKIKKDSYSESDSDGEMEPIKGKGARIKQKRDNDGDYKPYRSTRKPQKMSKRILAKKESKAMKIEFKQEEL